MPPENKPVFAQEPVPEQVVAPKVQTNSQPAQPETKKNKFIFYLAIAFAVILISFTAWSGYQIYKIKTGPAPIYIPGPSPPTSVILSPGTTPRGITHKGTFVCLADGGCVVYPKTDARKFCPKTYQTVNCDNECGNINNRCSK